MPGSPFPTQPTSDRLHRRVTLIAQNPIAGARDSHKLTKQIVLLCDQKNEATEVITDLKLLKSRITQLTQKNLLHAVLAAGGDGTISAVASLLPKQIPIAICPQGTENVLAKHLGISKAPAQIVQTLFSKKTIPLDTWQANGTLFLLMVGVGFDASVVHGLHKRRTGHISKLSYLRPLLETIFRYKYPPFKITYKDTTGNQQETVARWAFVSNITRYALGLEFSPNACQADQLLDVCLLKKGSLLYGLKAFLYLLVKKHHLLQEVSQFRCQELELTLMSEDPTQRTIPFQTDGDPQGILPLVIKPSPKPLLILVP